MSKTSSFNSSSRRPAEKKAKSVRLPVNKFHPVKKFVQVEDTAVETRKMNEISELVSVQATMDEEKKHVRFVRAVELFESLKPVDGAESMLAAQMVGTHTAALSCLQRAVIPSHQKAINRDLSTSSVKCMIKSAAKRDGLNPSIVDEFSGHSLRIGAAQDLLHKGFDTAAIMRAGGWKSVNTLPRYLEEAEYNV